MTSSLVGSEMCIRDRLISGLMYHTDMAQPNQQFIGGRGMLFYIVGSTAVSYTHLTLPTICSV
eukprot:11566197-Prorocentrum_lima.AAC.1